MINKYNWKRKKFPIKIKKCKKSERHEPTVALKIMFVKTNQEKTKQVYISEKNSECKKQAHILMISDGKKIFCGKNISYIKRNNMVTLMMKKRLQLHEKVCSYHEHCDVIKLKENDKMLKYAQTSHKYINKTCIICADIKSFLQKNTSMQR